MRQRLDDKRFRQYVGIDLSAEAIRRAGSMADEPTTFVCGDFTDFDGPTVDVVVLNEVLYFAASPARMLDHVGECLRAGGLLLTSIWRHPGDRSLWRLLDQRFEALDVVRVCNESSRLAPDGWPISCHRNPTVETAANPGMGL
jgi:SAM-dependent methyltransferase